MLLEETPALDTIEVRRTVRIVAGSFGALVLLIVSVIGYHLLTAKSVKIESSDAEKIELVDIHKLMRQSETEAATLLERGHEAALRGNHELAIRVLTRVSNAYPGTRAADAAREALARPVQHLPLFPDSPPLASTAAPNAIAPGSSTEASTGKSAVAPPPVVDSPEAALAAAKAGLTSRTESTGPSTAKVLPPAPADPALPRVLPSGFQARSGVGLDPSGWPLEIVSSRDGAMMVLVPGGPFIMGRDGGDAAEAPAHLVKVSTYYIDKHEVTNRQFEMFLKENWPALRSQPGPVARGGPGQRHRGLSSGHGQRQGCPGLRRLGGEAVAYRGAVGEGRPGNRPTSLSLGHNGRRVGKTARASPDRSGHVVPERPLALWGV